MGDWISSQLDNRKNIENRVNIGISTISQIMSMLKQVSLGYFYVEIGLIFRESMLISRLLFNSEVWLRVKKDQLKKLTAIDELYLRRILGLKQTVNKESLYLETGMINLPTMIQQRMIMYYWQLLQRNNSELTVKILNAQKHDTEKFDWFEQIQCDLKELKIDLNEEQIKSLSKLKFKQYVKARIVGNL